MTQGIDARAIELDYALGRIKSHAQKRAEAAEARVNAGFPGVGIATIVLDHAKARAGLRAAGRVHWLPSEFYEPVARLDGKYAGMDAAMRNWLALLDEAEKVAREDA